MSRKVTLGAKPLRYVPLQATDPFPRRSQLLVPLGADVVRQQEEREEERVCHVTRAGLETVETFGDIGGTGAFDKARSYAGIEGVGKGYVPPLRLTLLAGVRLAENDVWL